MKKIFFLFIVFAISQNAKAQGWSLVWSDSFNHNTINTSNWTFETGNSGWGNNELQYYTSRAENATIKNGNLLIIAKKENYLGSNYTSARIISKGLQSWTYGKIEARLKMNQTQGLWPAFWMLGSNISQVSWPTCGEIDIMEHVNTETKIHGTMHWNNNGHVQVGGNVNCNVISYHTYGIEWDADSIKWMLDNYIYYRSTIKNNVNNTNAFHKPFYLLLNIAVGGNWPGSPISTSVFPDTMAVDYINVFQKFPTSTNEIAKENKLNVYPNPAHETINFSYNNTLVENYSLKVYTIYGSLIHQSNTNKNVNPLTLNLSSFPVGMYFYTIQYSNNAIVKGKFLKE